MKIRILDEKTYSQIAAGEVIERPASVIRELIDNSLDAQSTQIDIVLTIDEDVFELSVKDNGHGIEKMDLPLAIKKHATSKITEFEDIFSLNTMGFRGEALSSIASVSKMNIISSTKEDGHGYKMSAISMEIMDIIPSMRDRGTTIKVKDIFFNTPVRQKFLKSVIAEKSEIKREIILKVLASEGVGFTYLITKDNKSKQEIKIPPSFTLKDKIYYLFGKKLYDNLIEVKGHYGEEENRVWVEGFITNQRYRAKLRKDQYFFLFNRPIENTTLSKAFNSAYINLLPSKTVASCFLKIEMNKQDVDVNVHPMKKNVRFEKTDILYRTIYHTIKNRLYEYIYESQKNTTGDMPFETYEKLNDLYNGENNREVIKDESEETQDFSYREYEKPLELETGVGGQTFVSREDSNVKDIVMSNEGETQDIDIAEERALIPNIIVHGQIAKNYILYSIGTDLFIIDQHAAHERINFDTIKKRVEEKKDFQYLLIPIVIDFSISMIDKVKNVEESLKNIGLEFETFGETSIKLDKIPNFFIKDNRPEIIQEIIEWVVDNPNVQKTDMLEKMVSTMACRMSIMAGRSLSLMEMHDLLKEIYSGKYVFNCPHGRPFIKKFSLGQIEKFFER